MATNKMLMYAEKGRGARTAQGQPTNRQVKPLAEKNLQRSRVLMKRMYYFATNKIDPATKKPVEMTSNQIKAAQVIIDRSMPTLKSQELKITDNRPKLSTEEVKLQVVSMFAKNPKLMELALQQNPQLLDAYGVVSTDLNENDSQVIDSSVVEDPSNYNVIDNQDDSCTEDVQDKPRVRTRTR